MNFFNSIRPIVRPKQKQLDIQDLQGLWRVHLKVAGIALYSASYTRIDQVFILWGFIAGSIFINAQFLPISWSLQAIFWSALTLIGTIGMVVMTRFWVEVERLCWVVYFWSVLMLGGDTLTDLSLYFGWGEVLSNLCPLWLGLSAVGYIGTAFGLQSRSFLITGLVHLFGIAALPYFEGWQFLATGIVMAGSLLFLAEVQWDMMRLPTEYNLLTPEQKQFNQEQQKLRQSNV